MTPRDATKVFEEKQVRTVWDDALEQWYVSIIDVIKILTKGVEFDSVKSNIKIKN